MASTEGRVAVSLYVAGGMLMILANSKKMKILTR